MELGREISQGKGLIGVNIMVVLNQYEELVKQAVKEKVDYIISGAGLPLNLPQLVEDEDILLAPIVSSLRALKLINRVWLKRYNRLPDFVVLEGKGAGGHIGFKKEDLEEGKSLEELTIINSPVGILGRAIKNDFLKKIEKERKPSNKCINCLQTCNPKTTQFCISDALIFAGSNLNRVKEIVGVKSIIEKIIEEYEEK